MSKQNLGSAEARAVALLPGYKTDEKQKSLSASDT